MYRRDGSCNYLDAPDGSPAIRLCATWWDAQDTVNIMENIYIKIFTRFIPGDGRHAGAAAAGDGESDRGAGGRHALRRHQEQALRAAGLQPPRPRRSQHHAGPGQWSAGYSHFIKIFSEYVQLFLYSFCRLQHSPQVLQPAEGQQLV